MGAGNDADSATDNMNLPERFLTWFLCCEESPRAERERLAKMRKVPGLSPDVNTPTVSGVEREAQKESK